MVGEHGNNIGKKIQNESKFSSNGRSEVGMPHPLDFLSGLVTPMVPKRAIQPVQDWIDSPTGDYGPVEARLRGFGAGALEGLRGFTTPVDVAAAALPIGLIGRGMRNLGRGAQNAPEAIQGLQRAIPDELPWDDFIRGVQNEPHPGLPSIDPAQFDDMGRRIYNVPDNPAAQALEAQRLGIERRVLGDRRGVGRGNPDRRQR